MQEQAVTLNSETCKWLIWISFFFAKRSLGGLPIERGKKNNFDSPWITSVLVTFNRCNTRICRFSRRLSFSSQLYPCLKLPEFILFQTNTRTSRYFKFWNMQVSTWLIWISFFFARRSLGGLPIERGKKQRWLTLNSIGSCYI